MKFAPTNKIELPEGFLDGFTALDDHQKQLLLEALDDSAPVSIRLNPDKAGTGADLELLDGSSDSIGWCSNGYYLGDRPKFTLDPLHHSGRYYVQEAGSMFIEQLFRQGACSNYEPMTILDLCASPGGKSTLLSSLAPEGAIVVANEVIHARTGVLAENVRRWGRGNTAVSSNDAAHFRGLNSFFDLIVVDAPCSGEGMFRKDHKARGEWSAKAVEMCAARQRRILSDIWGALKVGGTLVYSTCTFNNSENEDNVRWLSDNFDCRPLHIETSDDWGIVRGEVCGIETFRFLPHKTRSEGFFAAIMQKGSSSSLTLGAPDDFASEQDAAPRNKDKKNKKKAAQSGSKNIFAAVTQAEKAELERWVESPEKLHFARIGDSCFAFEKDSFAELEMVAANLGVVYSGVAMGRFFGSDFKPEHALALYKGVNRTVRPTVELTREQALEYLRKHDLDASLFEAGINLLCYKNTPIGWIKRSGNRTTNMLPKELRIMNL